MFQLPRVTQALLLARAGPCFHLVSVASSYPSPLWHGSDKALSLPPRPSGRILLP